MTAFYGRVLRFYKKGVRLSRSGYYHKKVSRLLMEVGIR